MCLLIYIRRIRTTNCIYSEISEFTTHSVECLIFVSGNGILRRAKKKKGRGMGDP